MPKSRASLFVGAGPGTDLAMPQCEGYSMEQTGIVRPAGFKILFAILLVLTAAAALLLTG